MVWYQFQYNAQWELMLLKILIYFKSLINFIQLHNSIVTFSPGIHCVPQKPIE